MRKHIKDKGVNVTTIETVLSNECVEGKNGREGGWESIDIYKHGEKMPPEVMAILDDHIERLRKAIYPFLQCRITCEALAKIGFNCEFDRHANLYDLRPIKG